MFEINLNWLIKNALTFTTRITQFLVSQHDDVAFYMQHGNQILKY
jgi:hypothetical protein